MFSRGFKVVLIFFLFVHPFAPLLWAKKAEKAPVSLLKETPPKVEQVAPAPAPSAWEKYPPDIQVSQWGPEFRIVVTPNPIMDEEKRLAIQAVKVESPEGDFLGLKTYGPTEEKRVAEFAVNAKILKLDSVKITASSSLEGDWTQEVLLEPSDTTEVTKAQEAPSPEPSVSQPPKKKLWFW